MPRLPRPLATALGLMLFVSCSNPGWVCGCPPAVPRAGVNGHVTGPDGAPVVFATVSVQTGPAGCAGPFTPAGFPRSELDGSYGMGLYGDEFDTDGCVRAYADPPPLSPFRASDTVTVPVRFTRDGESVRVDLVLRAP